jgi:hypothetical protein
MKQEFQDKVRIQINRFIFSNGFAPTTSQLTRIVDSNETEVKNALKQLAENHAIVLHPNSYDIWVAHPFALFPTLFWVESGDKKWWGNCSWCSLGIAAMSKEDTRIFTKTCGESDPLRIDITNGQVIQKDLLVHFSITAKRFWDNVIYTCSNLLTFDNERQINDWCNRHNMTKGEVLTLEQVWELSKIWYGNYLDDTWTRKTPEYAELLFKKVGLTGDFWKLS